MQPRPFSLPPRPKLGEKDFKRISAYIEKNFGIRLPLSKMVLVESRLIKRIIKSPHPKIKKPEHSNMPWLKYTGKLSVIRS